MIGVVYAVYIVISPWLFALPVFSHAVMTLRQFERRATRKQDQMRDARHLQNEHTKRVVQNTQLKEAVKDKHILLVRL